MKRFTATLLSGFISILFNNTVLAQAESLSFNEVIENMVDAYGGDALLNMKSYSFSNTFDSYSVFQSQKPDVLDKSTATTRISVDLENHSGILERYQNNADGSISHNGTMIKDKVRYNFDFRYGDYTKTDQPDFIVSQVIGSSIRLLDILLIKSLSENKEGATYKGLTWAMGKQYYQIEHPVPNSSTMDMFIDAETFLLHKSSRNLAGIGMINYYYSEHTRNGNITHAVRTEVNWEDKLPVSVMTSSVLTVNNVDNSAFDMGSIKQRTAPERPLIARPLGNGAYQVGSGFTYSVFVDVGDYIVSSGGNSGVIDRFKEYQRASGKLKPLKYHISTHHHSDHVSGMEELIHEGVTIVTVEAHVQPIRESVGKEVSDDSFYIISGKTVFGEGSNNPVEVYDINTAHTEHLLVPYLTKSRHLFIADAFEVAQANRIPESTSTRVSLLNSINQLGLQVEGIIGAHTPYLATLNDLKKSVQKKQPACLYNREICQTGG